MCCLNRTRTLFWCLSCVLMAAGAAHAQTTWPTDVTDAPGAKPGLRTPAAGEKTTLDDMPDGLRRAVAKALEKDAHAIRAAGDHDGASGYQAVNRKNGLRFSFDGRGVGIAPRGDSAAWSARMTLAGIGYEGNVRALPDGAAPQVRIDGNRIEYHHRLDLGHDQGAEVSVVEWYVNDRRGLEQGFTLAARPGRSGDSSAPLCLDLAVSGDVTPVLAEGGSSIRFLDGSGADALRYGHLHVFDARERELPARLRAAPGLVSIVVDDRAAVYPLTIDPLFEVAKLTASDAAAGDLFGNAVSISGDTAIVGAYGNDDAGTGSGSAYIFHRDQGGLDNWGGVKKLTASDAAAGDGFGYSVSIGGDTAIVGADRNDDACPSDLICDSGSAYIFRRDQGGVDNWGEVAKLTASDAAAGDYFGSSVSISGHSAIVGAFGDDDAGLFSGSAYIFQRDQGGADNWGQVRKLTASDAAAGDRFGNCAISGDTAIVGAYGNSDAGDDSGSAYIFRRDQGAPDNWGEVTKLTASDAAAEDYFGVSVSISGDTAIVGAHGNSDAGPLSGSAYIFRRDQGGLDNWGEVKKLTASDAAADDRFGSCAISGDTAIVGAFGDSDAGSFCGSAYIFRRNEAGLDNWGEVAKLTAPDAAAEDWFGRRVSVSGDTAIVGAFGNSDAGDYSGSAYIFSGTVHNVTQDTWHITIQRAIDVAMPGGDEIAVAPGTYQEAIDFLGKAITLRSTDGPEVTTIDATGLGSSVVKCSNGEGPDTVLEGFTVTGGTGTDPGDGYPRGGGMYNDGTSPTVTNCTFSGNTADWGAGMYNYDDSSPTVTNCTFSANTAFYGGGGMCNEWFSDPTATNCTFSGNTAASGGGMINSQSRPAVTNCTFSGNSGDIGAGMFNDVSSEPTVANCTFSANGARTGGGMYNRNYSSPTVTNCILWGNTGDEIVNVDGGTASVTYSDVQGGYTGTGNIDADPLFVDADGPDDTFGTEDDNLRLQGGSPCIDVGSNAAVIVPTDLDGNVRIVDGDGDATPTVDMGAFEFASILDDCNENGIRDMCDLDCNALGGDCNVPDCGLSSDGDADGYPDECETVHNVTQGTWHPWIQLAIDSAVGGDEIVAGPGTYQEAINFLGKGITVRSTGGPEATIIDASGLGASVVTCANGEGRDTVLDGFTITGGTGTYWGDDVLCGGGMFNEYSSPTVSNCTFTGNSAEYGGGMFNAYNSGPTVTNCTFTGNSGGGMDNSYDSSPTVTNCTFTGNSGGGMDNYDSTPTVTNCTFAGNSASWDGGGMHNRYSSPTVTNCTFTANTACWGAGMANNDSSSPTVTDCTFSGNISPGCGGGGMYNGRYSSPTVTNCMFTGNSGVEGGGGMVNYYDSSPTVTNCTFTENSAEGGSGGGMSNFSNSSPTVRNCILWGNTAQADPQIHGSADVTYSCVQGGLPGEGNIDADPLFVDDVNGDVRLGCASPCVDAGDNNAVPVGVTTDLTGNPRFVDDTGVDDTGAGAPPIVDMGAYERQDTSEPSSPTDYYVGDNTCPDTGAGTEGDPFCRIQTAINVACDGDEIIVLPGTYNEAIDFQGKAVTLGSSHGADMTTIDATGLGTRVVACVSGEGPDTILDGFTITEGRAGYCGGMLNSHSSPTVTNCTFTRNEALSAWGGGMCNYSGSPTVNNCTFTGNSAEYGGGMLNSHSSPTVSNCTFTGNLGAEGGGGMYNESASPTVTNCKFAGNTANGEGGGMYNYLSGPTVTNCTFAGNSASSDGGGMHNRYSSPTVTNCVFRANEAFSGGGMYNWDSSPTVTNCTFTGNSAAEIAGGICNYVNSSPTVTNCILWGDAPNEIDADGSGTPAVTYSDVQGGTEQPWFGVGCVDVDPLFVDADGPDDTFGTEDDNLRLQGGSPCIDVGSNAGVTVPTDLDGHARVLCGRVDMGAYEFGIGDYDCNYGVDLIDFSMWPACMTGPGGGPYGAGCEAFDFEYDGDVDLSDFAGYQSVFSD